MCSLLQCKKKMKQQQRKSLEPKWKESWKHEKQPKTEALVLAVLETSVIGLSTRVLSVMKGTGVKTLSLHKTGVATETLPHLYPHHISRTLKGLSLMQYLVCILFYSTIKILQIFLFLVKFDHYQRDRVFLFLKKKKKTKTNKKTTSWESVTIGPIPHSDLGFKFILSMWSRKPSP